MNGIIGMYKKKPEWLKIGNLVKLNAQGMKSKKNLVKLLPHEKVAGSINTWGSPKVGLVISERIPRSPPAGHLKLYPDPKTWVQVRTILWNTGDKRDVREDELELAHD